MLNPFLYNHLFETKINNKYKTVQITQPHTKIGSTLKSISILLYIKRKNNKQKVSAPLQHRDFFMVTSYFKKLGFSTNLPH